MLFSLNILIFASIFLFLVNFFQKKKNFLIDKITDTENHKILLNTKKKVPLSGFLYFLPIIFFLNFEKKLFFKLACMMFFFIGFMSDSKFAKSPKLRLSSQFLVLFVFLFFENQITIDTRIDYLNFLLENELLRILIISFFFLVLLNGFNFIDGVNNLCSLNFLIVLIFLFLLSIENNLMLLNDELHLLILFLLIFVIFNFLGKNYLGDGAVYGLSFLIGYICIVYSSLETKISPYFIASLLWYPAFENLFSIIRRTFKHKKNYLPDNDHLHQLLFKFLQNKNWIKKKSLLSSATGILINIYLLIGYYIAYSDYSETFFQIILILINITIYLLIYFWLKNKTYA